MQMSLFLNAHSYAVLGTRGGISQSLYGMQGWECSPTAQTGIHVLTSGLQGTLPIHPTKLIGSLVRLKQRAGLQPANDLSP